MPTLTQLIKEEKHPNPFNHLTYGNFWLEKPQYETVNLHQQSVDKIGEEIKHLKNDLIHKTRTILLIGEQGCGKSHFLGRLKENFNPQAFFVYIQPIPNQDYLWRHTLRYTVDSLMQTSQGEKDSQIRQWLKGLPAFQDEGLFTKLIGKKRAFVNQLRQTYPAGIYEAKKFFGILYELAQDENYFTACDWLRGDSLDEEDLEALNINKSVESEVEAQGILNNFGRIADATKPIVLCFDQIERATEEVFQLNTSFHNECLTNFLIVISIIRQDWSNFKQRMIQSDISRINNYVNLGNINFDEVEKLWASRLKPLHSLCNPQPENAIAPLDKVKLEEKAPAGKINLRESLNFASKLYQKYQEGKKDEVIEGGRDEEENKVNPFVLLWNNELKETQNKINKIKQYPEPELLDMLTLVLQAYKIQNINKKLLSGKNSVNSIYYQCPQTQISQGLVWQENLSAASFTALMKACKEAQDYNRCDSLFLLRNASVGNSKTKANKLYRSLFKPLSKEYIHLKYSLEDIHSLYTYTKLARNAYSGELVIDFKQITIRELQELAIQHRVLAECELLQKLAVVSSTVNEGKTETSKTRKRQSQLKPKVLTIHEEIERIVKINSLIGLNRIVSQIQTNPKFAHLTLEETRKIVDELRQQKKITFLNSDDNNKDLVVCAIPKKK